MSRRIPRWTRPVPGAPTADPAFQTGTRPALAAVMRAALVVVLVLIAIRASAQAPVTLAQAVAQARVASPLRRAAVALSEGAAAAADVAGRRPNPLIEVRTENWTPSPHASVPLDIWALVTQPIELGGKRGLRQSIAVAEKDLAAATVAQVDRQAAIETVRAYIQALKARGLVETLGINREGLGTLIETMRRRVAEGFAAETDLLKFETEAARVDTDSARAGLELERSLRRLALVAGYPMPLTPAQLVEPPDVAPPDVSADAVAGLIGQHPDVLSAGARVTRATQNTALERARRIPDPSVVTGYKRTAGQETVMGAVLVAVPVFDRNAAAVARAAGDTRAAAADRDLLAQQLAAEALSQIRAAQILADRSRRAEREMLTPADGVRNAARAAFREGSADVLKLVDAERVYADVRRSALDLRLDALAAAIEARFALGEEMLP